MSKLAEITAINKALSDPGRMRALMMLKNGPLCLCQLIEMLELAPSTVSRHMSQLVSAGLVVTEKEGKWTNYRLAEEDADTPAGEAIKWMQKALIGDPFVDADREKLNVISKMDKKDLCKRYSQ